MLRIVRSQLGCAARMRALSTSGWTLPAPAVTRLRTSQSRTLGTRGSILNHAQEHEKTSGEAAHVDASLAHVPLPDLFSLRDRTILITGGGRGIGLTLVRAVLEAGAHVRALDLLPAPTEPEWSAAMTLADEKGLSLGFTTLDVTSEPDVCAVVKDVFASAPRNAPVRGLFHAAGVSSVVPSFDYSPERFRKVLDVNLTGSFLVAQAFAREFFARGAEARKDASIVLVGSISGHVAHDRMPSAAYSASKAGVRQLARNLAMEWGPQGIRVNSLSPGYVKTPLMAAVLAQEPAFEGIWLQNSFLRRPSTPDEMRGPVVYLLSDASSFMTGADILVDGGLTAM